MTQDNENNDANIPEQEKSRTLDLDPRQARVQETPIVDNGSVRTEGANHTVTNEEKPTQLKDRGLSVVTEEATIIKDGASQHQEGSEKKLTNTQQSPSTTSGIETPSTTMATKSPREVIYDQQISPAYFGAVPKSQEPTLVILAGQGGSGKSQLANVQIDRFANDGGAVRIDPDQLRHHSPGYEQDIRTESRTAADKAPVRDWTNEVFVEALAHKTNIVLDGTAGNAKQVEQRISLARAAGYKVEVHAVAVNGTDSWLSVLDRHETNKVGDQQSPDRRPEARFVPKDVHDNNTRGVTETLGRVEYKGLADTVAVYTRGQYDTPIYSNTSASQGGTFGAAEALEQERGRPRTPDELAARQATIQRVDALMEARDASVKERAEVSMLAFQGDATGFRRTAESLTTDQRPTISAEDYIRSPEARQEYRDQAQDKVKAYAAELRQSGMPEERVAKVEKGLQKKLDNPVQAYGIKEGLELREMRQELKQTESRAKVRDYYNKQDRVATDVTKVKEAFGVIQNERTPTQSQQAKNRTSWDRQGQENLADIRLNVTRGIIKPQDQAKYESRSKEEYAKGKARAHKRTFERAEKQTTGDRTQSSTSRSQGGGRSSGVVQTMQRYKYKRHRRMELIF